MFVWISTTHPYAPTVTPIGIVETAKIVSRNVTKSAAASPYEVRPRYETPDATSLTASTVAH